MVKNFFLLLVFILFVLIYMATGAENYGEKGQPMISPNSDMKITKNGVQFISGWDVAFPPPKPEIKVIRETVAPPVKPTGSAPIKLLISENKKPGSIEEESKEDSSEYPRQPLKLVKPAHPTFEDYKLLEGDCPGGDLEPRIGIGIDDCKEVCDTDPSCRGFTYDIRTQICTPKSITCAPAAGGAGSGRDTVFYEKTGKYGDSDYTWQRGVCRPAGRHSRFLSPEYQGSVSDKGKVTAKGCLEACNRDEGCIGFDILNMDDKNEGDCVLHKYGPIKPYSDLVVSDKWCSPDGHRCRCYVHRQRRGYERQLGVCRPASAHHSFLDVKTHPVKIAGRHPPEKCARICAATPDCGGFEYANTAPGEPGQCVMHLYPDPKGFHDESVKLNFCKPNGNNCSCYVMSKK